RDRRALPDGAPVADRAPLAQGRPGAREGAPPAPESPARRALRCAAGLGGCAGARRPRARRPELLNAVPGWWRGRSRDGSPPDAGRAVRRALVAVLDGDLERAEALLAGVVQRDSQELDVYLALARLFRQRGEIGRAIHVHQSLLLRPDVGGEARFAALVGLADDFRAGGFLRRAIAAYEEVLAERPDHLGALRALVA